MYDWDIQLLFLATNFAKNIVMESCGERYFKALRELLFPEYCYACGRELSKGENVLCKSCFEEFPLTYFWSWHNNPGLTRLLENCAIENFYSLFFYTHDSDYKNLIHSFKYQGDTRVGLELAKWLGEYIANDENFPGFDAIIPIPLHFYKHWKRGYNQSEVIAKGISQKMGDIPVLKNILVRTRYTTTQTHLSDRERVENVRGVFKVVKRISDDINRHSSSCQIVKSNKELCSDTLNNRELKHILLVDDVLTTGSTILSALTAIYRQRDIKVSVATLGFADY